MAIARLAKEFEMNPKLHPGTTTVPVHYCTNSIISVTVCYPPHRPRPDLEPPEHPSTSIVPFRYASMPVRIVRCGTNTAPVTKRRHPVYVRYKGASSTNRYEASSLTNTMVIDPPSPFSSAASLHPVSSSLHNLERILIACERFYQR